MIIRQDVPGAWAAGGGAGPVDAISCGGGAPGYSALTAARKRRAWWMRRPGNHPWHILSGVNLATVAAFAAAGLSLVNVAVSARLTSRGRLDQWRREQEQPVVARMLTLSSDAVREWKLMAAAKLSVVARIDRPDVHGHEDLAALRARVTEHRERGWELCTSLYFEAAQLDILADPPVRATAHELVRAHEHAYLQLVSTNVGETSDMPTMHHRAMDLHEKLVMTTRQDFGLDNKGYQRMRLIRRFRAE